MRPDRKTCLPAARRGRLDGNGTKRSFLAGPSLKNGALNCYALTGSQRTSSTDGLGWFLKGKAVTAIGVSHAFLADGRVFDRRRQ
jgi:hypothetical protein